MGMIRAEKLVFEYDKRDEDGNVIGSRRAIDGVDIDIPQGSFVAVLGHNGSGKSTLAKHMNAILVPTDGTMWVVVFLSTAWMFQKRRMSFRCERPPEWFSRIRTIRSLPV